MEDTENSNLDSKKNDDIDETVSSLTENTDETFESKASSSDDETNETIDNSDTKCGIKRKLESDSEDQESPAKIPKNDFDEKKNLEKFEEKDMKEIAYIKANVLKTDIDSLEIKSETSLIEVKKEIESPLTSPVSTTSQASSINKSVLKSPGTMEATRQSVRANRNSNPAACLIKKPKLPTDMSNPLYKEPFKYGWRRELVYRANTDATDTKRNGDIYYFTPDGKKVRSMREVIENLRNKELSTDNFTFYKEPLGLDNPELEIIRVAKVKGASSTPNQSKSVKKKERSSVDKKPTSQTPAISFGKSTKSKIGGFKVKLQGARLSQGKRPSQGKSEKKSSLKSPLQMGTLPPGWQGSSKSSKSKPNMTSPSGVDDKKVKRSSQCSIRCTGVDPVVPTMQCSVCLCLYHPECVGLRSQSVDLPEHYICQNCLPVDQVTSQNDNSEADATLPSLTPINAAKSHTPSTSLIPPKLHKIKNDNQKDSSVSQKKCSTRTMKLLPTRSSNDFTPVTNEITSSKSLVGSVTTWLQPSSTIKMVQSNDSSASLAGATEPTQSQAIIGGRKFIIIPKQNILSVHPNEYSSMIPASENAPTPASSNINSSSTVNDSSMPPNIPASIDSIPASASLGPANTFVDDVITHVIDTNNGQQKTDSSPSLLNPPDDSNQSPLSRQQGNKENSFSPSNKQFGKSVTSLKSKRIKKSLSSPKLQSTPSTVAVESTEGSIPVPPKRDEFMKNFLDHLSAGYVCLLHVFQYLKMQELLRASRVCRMWRDLANHSSLWRIVRMKNSKVTDWNAFVTALIKHEPRTLDLRKMLTSGNNNKKMWPILLEALPKIESLTRIDLCRCPPEVVEKLAEHKPNLEVITATSIICQSLDISSFDKFVNLQELRLRSNEGMELKPDLTPFKDLPLKHLSLTSVKSLGKKNIELIATFTQLESLELGECDELPEQFGSEILTKLEHLERIRLEKGPQTSCTYDMLRAIGSLPKVEQLELVNFDVKTGFDEAIAACTNIKKLLLIPTYISQSATTNHTVLNGVAQLTSSLTCFIWGVTMELLRVTELFVDQCDHTPNKKRNDSNTKKNKKNNESIPILKPVPLIFDDDARSNNPGQVEILPISTLEKLLSRKLSNAKVSILRVPFHATWRQSIADCMQ